MSRKSDFYENIARVFAFLRKRDPEHLPYYNHWSVNMNFCGAHSYEELWDRFQENCGLDYISADGYPLEVCSEKKLLTNHVDQPHHYPRRKVTHMRHYFEMLDITRQYSRRHGVPLWGFMQSQPAWSMEGAEGEMRYQLMTALVYGAKALQYFTCTHNDMMIAPDGTPNPLWHAAKRINREIRAWEPVIKGLRNINVYHHPADFYYTRSLEMTVGCV
ncbi:MAG: hypothetical protein HQL31_02440 [Planctomycetes bacterium]|nr:hypothetical protein [Planctomycetota bacterium]